MTTLAIGDHLGLLFGLVCIIAWLCFVLLMARFCGRGERLAAAQRRAERREVDGPMASVLDFSAEREARVNRARFRSVTRHGKDVA